MRLVLAQHPAGKNRAGHKEEVPADVAECPAVVYFYLLAEPFSRIDTQLRLPGQIQVTTSLSTPNDWFWPEAEVKAKSKSKLAILALTAIIGSQNLLLRLLKCNTG